MQSHYKYNFVAATQSYHFTTKNGIEYKVVFIVDHTFSTVSNLEINNVYQIIIEKVSLEAELLDVGVQFTIRNIIEIFFKNEQNSLLYFCDDTDFKAATRFNVFERWYNNSQLTEIITKLDNIIQFEIDGTIRLLYTSLLLHIENKNRDKIIAIYEAMHEILNEK